MKNFSNGLSFVIDSSEDYGLAGCAQGLNSAWRVGVTDIQEHVGFDNQGALAGNCAQPIVVSP